ncbi:ABC transporter permease [Actinophytocola oryzae]|uniref:NitT/TauT family transport system permease protein n=1 Tax=Actinophytocola oryzae TaxID=502181 RepID=A0A4R7W1C6_9PSEU|nr:ABC transporter permease [Actinophytocola oryzae]TDV56360.1 NitT/TauT family transport system permease protein [Actinophytocola oryzae]
MTAVLRRPVQADPAVPPAPRRRRHRLVLGGGLILALLAVWEIAALAAPRTRFYLSSPTDVVATLGTLTGDGTFWSLHVLTTARGFAAGWAIAVVAGIGLGVLMGWSRAIRETLEPFVFVLNAVPRVALIPLLVVWLGYGFAYQVTVVALWSVFPVLLDTIAGVRDAKASLVRMARVFGASPGQVLVTVALPGSVPLVMAGVRQALSHAITGVVGAEIWASAAGIGWVIADAAQTVQVERIIAAVVLVAVAGAVLNELLGVLERRLTRWKEPV